MSEYESGDRLITNEEYQVFSNQLVVCVLWHKHLPYTGECDCPDIDRHLDVAKKMARKGALAKLEHYNKALLLIRKEA